MATPQIPPRPLRSKLSGEQSQAPETTAQIPPVPPRPVARLIDGQDSHRDSFAPSPLNDPPFVPKAGPYVAQAEIASSSTASLPARPPSVTLPSIGQEGSEYADIVNMEQEQPLSKTLSQSSETTTSHVGSDLPLHAPKPSLSQSDQRARIQTVTRTDSDRAASAGVGRRRSLQADEPLRGLKSKSSVSLRSPSVASTERPGSAQAEELGIPEIGIQVPMYPNAGDVQAPSPALQGSFPLPQNAGLHSDRPRHHGRTRSGREVFTGPPGSYGLHGHGVNSTDKFEKAWYDKHPEAFAQEGQYSAALNNVRSDYVLSSEDLNKLVQGTAKRSVGFGTSANVVGLPDEQIGYMASEEYATRMASRPTSSYASKSQGNDSQTNAESPLRKTSFPAGAADKPQFDSKDSSLLSHPNSATKSDSEIIHIDAPKHRINKVTSEGVSTPTIDLGPRGGNTEHEGGYIDEQGYGVPILASDEIRPGSEWQKPAVSPMPEERRASIHDIARFSSRPESASGSRPTSRPGSRPGSVHLHHGLSRYTSHEEHDSYTPLDDVEEYEPLFEDEETKANKPLTQAERLKYRPDMRRRFPSQDIWEDTPNSLQLQAEIENQQAPDQSAPEAQKSTTFEPPAAEAARKGEVGEEEKAKLIKKEERLAKSNFKPHIRDEIRRPGMSQRFPSRDIWEDSPDSARLETTVGDRNEEDAGLAAGAVVQTGDRSRGGATASASVQPATNAGTSGKPTDSSKIEGDGVNHGKSSGQGIAQAEEKQESTQSRALTSSSNAMKGSSGDLGTTPKTEGASVKQSDSPGQSVVQKRGQSDDAQPGADTSPPNAMKGSGGGTSMPSTTSPDAVPSAAWGGTPPTFSSPGKREVATSVGGAKIVEPGPQALASASPTSNAQLSALSAETKVDVAGLKDRANAAQSTGSAITSFAKDEKLIGQAEGRKGALGDGKVDKGISAAAMTGTHGSKLQLQEQGVTSNDSIAASTVSMDQPKVGGATGVSSTLSPQGVEASGPSSTKVELATGQTPHDDKAPSSAIASESFSVQPKQKDSLADSTAFGSPVPTQNKQETPLSISLISASSTLSQNDQSGTPANTPALPDSTLSEAQKEISTLPPGSNAPAGVGASQTLPSIPPRPTKDVHGHSAHPQVPPRPSKHHHQHHQHHAHATSPQEHSRLSEVYTVPSGEAGASSTGPHTLSSESSKSPPVEGRKPPVIPQRPKQHATARTAKDEPLSPEEATEANASRETFSPPPTAATQATSTALPSSPDITSVPLEPSGVSKAAAPGAISGSSGDTTTKAREGGSQDVIASSEADSHGVSVTGTTPSEASAKSRQPTGAAAYGPVSASPSSRPSALSVGASEPSGKSQQALGSAVNDPVSVPPSSRPSDLSAGTSEAASTTLATGDSRDTALGDVTSPPPTVKAKPTVPARPGGSKIAALQAGFMSDLNNRLKLGPQGPQKPAEPTEEEKVEEKAPLADARKARAKGPARRKPAVSPGPTADPVTSGEAVGAAATGPVAGAAAGSLAQQKVHPPSTLASSILLWQVHNSGDFDAVHANYVHHLVPSASLDGASEDIASVPLSKLASASTAGPPSADADAEPLTHPEGEEDSIVDAPASASEKIASSGGEDVLTGHGVTDEIAADGIAGEDA